LGTALRVEGKIKIEVEVEVEVEVVEI